MADPTLTPIPESRRTLSGIDIAAIRFGAAIVLSECRANTGRASGRKAN